MFFQSVFPVLMEIDWPFKLTLLGVTLEEDRKEIQTLFSTKKNIVLDIPEQINWLDEDDIYNRIKQFDIGIAPLIDHEFNKAKSAFRLKQYLSCGIPVIASNVGENKNFVNDGVNGFLYNTPKDFKGKLDLVKNLSEEKYRCLSGHARESSVLFTMRDYCNHFLEFCKKQL